MIVENIPANKASFLRKNDAFYAGCLHAPCLEQLGSKNKAGEPVPFRFHITGFVGHGLGTGKHHPDSTYVPSPTIHFQADSSESESSDDEPGVRRSAITGKKIKMKLENQTTEDHARAAGRKHLLQFMNSQF